jgi:hypothetical protein
VDHGAFKRDRQELHMSLAMVAADRRRSAPLTLQSNAFVSVLDTGDSFNGMLANVSDGGAQLRLDRSVPLSSLLKIECADFFLLGDVVSCEAVRGDWVVAIQVEHGMYGLKALADAIRKSWVE